MEQISKYRKTMQLLFAGIVPLCELCALCGDIFFE